MTYRVVHTDDVPLTDVENETLPTPLGDVRRVAALLDTDDLSLDVWHVDAGEVAPVRPSAERETAYLVLDGRFVLVVGSGDDREETVVDAGCFVSVSHEHTHGFENQSREPASLLTIAAPATDAEQDE
ncbi:cupin domain-containing protein [Halospeciosus flavus]|uniref:Cupin domain-containing protein n=1 Tax=Halospeciosus flavus TaxID=3032283 RepID=A0ABD5Z5B9_9EURY|nr:cupin domain-containing protein [Halospeciosus flavus]